MISSIFLLTSYDIHAQIRTKIALPSDQHRKIIEKLIDIFKRDSSEILTIDGVKAIIDDDSWALVRPSNTEHAIRVSVESRAYTVQGLHDEIVNKVRTVYDTYK